MTMFKVSIFSRCYSGSKKSLTLILNSSSLIFPSHLKLQEVNFVQNLPNIADIFCDPIPYLLLRFLNIYRQVVLDLLDSLASQPPEKGKFW